MNRFTIEAVALVLFALLAPLASGAQAAAENPLIVEDLRCRGNAATSCAFMLGYVYLEGGDRWWKPIRSPPNS